MRQQIFTLALVTLALSASLTHADIPQSVKCSIAAQEKARNEGPDFQRVYNRIFELCMLNAMPRERQTQYLIERLKPYVAISPGLEEQPAPRDEPRSTGTWVRISPNVWILEN
jgi:hypothetical protein